MRAALMAAALTACGSTSAQPARYVPEDEDVGPTRVASTPVDAQWTPQPVPSVLPSAADAVPVDAAAPVDAPTAEEPIVVEPEEVIENGVAVRPVSFSAWCATRARLAGACWPTKAECVRKGQRCVSTDAFACLDAQERTSGRQQVFCFSTWGLCDAFGASIERSTEVVSVSECTIHRRKK